MHLYFDIVLGLWGAAAPLAAYFIGRMTRRAPLQRSNAPLPAGLSRTEQHAFDAAHNPNYRGRNKITKSA